MHVSYTLLHLSAGGWWEEGWACESGRGREGRAGGGGRGRQMWGGRGGRAGGSEIPCADFCVAMGLLWYLIGLTVCVVDHEE